MNTSHYHKVEGAAEPVLVEGLAEHCDHCRQAKGLKPMSDVEKRLQGAGLTKTVDGGPGMIPADEAMRMLEEQEEINDELRQQVKSLADENAQLRAANAKLRKQRDPGGD